MPRKRIAVDRRLHWATALDARRLFQLRRMGGRIDHVRNGDIGKTILGGGKTGISYGCPPSLRCHAVGQTVYAGLWF